MDSDYEIPLDLSEFKCKAASRKGVVVVFEQTNRRYFFGWANGELEIAAPDIQGACAPHAPEVIDCLARAVAYRAAVALHDHPAHVPASTHRSLSSHLRNLLLRT